MTCSPETVQLLRDISLFDRAKLAVHTMNILAPEGSAFPQDDEENDARTAFAELTDEQLTAKKAEQVLARVAMYTKPAVQKLDRMLGEYDEELINNAVRIREYVRNKLLEESDNPDPKIRIKALELLGKVKDVGLFTDKIEITHKMKSDTELEEEIQRRLERFMGQANVIENEVVEVPPPKQTDIEDVLG